MARNLITYQDLMTQISSYLKQKKNIDMISKAYKLAEKMHKGQFRKGGDHARYQVSAARQSRDHQGD